MSVVTRFAPSPTGYLHIGGARTALFNKLYAQHMGGKYLVRIEDTDAARSTTEAVDAIHTSLNWLDLQGDEPIVYQSKNAARHIEVANELVARGAAYRDFTTALELTEAKVAHDVSGSKSRFKFVSRYRHMEDIPVPDLANPFTVRLKAPQAGVTMINDLVQGQVTVQNKELDDMVLLRSDGTPTYMLAVVVDDHDMGVTHVIRGDDHLNNAFRQLPIYQAMDWPSPVYAHIPLINSEDGKKLSKRTGAAGVEEYQAMGIPADAMLNYLARLGWGHGDNEIFSMAQAAEWFDIVDVGRAPSRINAKKLRSISSHYIKGMDSEELFVYIWQRSRRDRLDIASRVTPDQITTIVDALKPRSANLNELYDGAAFLWADRPIQLDGKAQEKINVTHVRDIWNMLLNVEWDAIGLEGVVARYLEEHPGLKLVEVATSLRAALTGKTVSPPIYDVMLTLGRDETLSRLKDISFAKLEA